jgi:hypothetical protein
MVTVHCSAGFRRFAERHRHTGRELIDGNRPVQVAVSDAARRRSGDDNLEFIPEDEREKERVQPSAQQTVVFEHDIVSRA